MKAGFVRLFTTIALGLIIGSSVFAEDATPQPGQIASAADTALTPAGIVSAIKASRESHVSIATIAPRRERVLNGLWIASLASMAAATSMDGATSYGKRERNSLIASSNGTFGGKAIGLKASLSAAAIASQLFMRKSERSKPLFTVMNFALTGVFTRAAIHNSGIPAVK